MTNSASDDTKTKASDHDIYGVATIASLLIPLVGIVLGIMHLTKETKIDRKLGEHLIAVSIFSSIIISALWYLYVINQNGSFQTTYSGTPTTLSNPSPAAPSWNVDVEYPKINEGMTKETVELTIKKTAENCSEYEQSANAETFASCTYGGTSSDSGIIVVNYKNNIVTTKEKVSF